MAVSLEDSQGRILKRKANGNFMIVEGITVPADAAAGYDVGCVFIHTDGGSASALYINRGSATSANFDRVPTFPINLGYGVGTVTTLMLIPVDRTNGVTNKQVAGRIAVAFDESSGSLIYIPVYYA